MCVTTPAAPTSTAATPSSAGASTASVLTSRRALALCQKLKVGTFETPWSLQARVTDPIPILQHHLASMSPLKMETMKPDLGILAWP